MSETRPVTDQQREAARDFADAQAERIRGAFGFITVRQHEVPQPQYGLHEILGLKVRPGVASLAAQTIGVYTGLVCDEFLARYRYENPLVSTLTWRHMPPHLRLFISSSSGVLPMAWTDPNNPPSEGFLDSRVRITAVTSVLRFLTA